MVIMILEKVPASLRGELSRWLFEVHPGCYLGHVNAMVRDKLWEKCAQSKKAGSVFQAWSTNNEQHFSMRLTGSTSRRVVDWEGVQFIQEIGDELSEVQKKRMEKG